MSTRAEVWGKEIAQEVMYQLKYYDAPGVDGVYVADPMASSETWLVKWHLDKDGLVCYTREKMGDEWTKSGVYLYVDLALDVMKLVLKLRLYPNR